MNEPVIGHNGPLTCSHCAVRHRAICASLANEELRDLNALASRWRAPAGTTIQTFGLPVDFVGSIVEGVVKLTLSLNDGREQIVGLLFSADFVGRPFADKALTSAVAVTDVELCRYPSDRFDTLLSLHRGLEERLFSDTLIELDRARNWLLLLGRKTATERVAAFLLMLADRQALDGCHHARDRQDVTLSLPLTRTEIADYLGLTVETVSRQLSQLKKSGAINIINNRQLRVPDRAGLSRLAGD